MLALLSGCTLNSSKRQYVLAETLWNDANYAASVTEFEKVHSRDPRGKLGLQALFRAATTQAFFLNQYEDAIRKFRTYAEVSDDKETAWEAQLQIGEILFSKVEAYDQAIQHYQMLIKRKPESAEAPEFLFRVGKSQFFLWKFEDAINTYRLLEKSFPNTSWAEQASYEIGVTYYTRGEQSSGGHTGSYSEAIGAYKEFLKKYPNSPWVPQVKFGIASCLEELDDLDNAYRAYEELKTTYPSPNVIAVKLIRLRERKTQRNR